VPEPATGGPSVPKSGGTACWKGAAKEQPEEAAFPTDPKDTPGRGKISPAQLQLQWRRKTTATFPAIFPLTADPILNNFGTRTGPGRYPNAEIQFLLSADPGQLLRFLFEPQPAFVRTIHDFCNRTWTPLAIAG